MKSLSPNAQEFIPTLNGPVQPMISVSGNLMHPSMHQSQVQLQLPTSSMFDHQSGSPIQPQHPAFSQQNHLIAVPPNQMAAPPAYGYPAEHMPPQYHHPQYQSSQSVSVSYVPTNMMHANSLSTTKPISVNTASTIPVNNTQYAGYVNQNMPTMSPHQQQMSSYGVNSPVLISAYPPPPQPIFANSPQQHQMSPASLTASSQPIILQQQPSPQIPPNHVYHPSYYPPQQAVVSQPPPNGVNNNMFYHNNTIVQQPSQLMMAPQAVPLNQSYPPHNYVTNTQPNNFKAPFNAKNQNKNNNNNNRQKPMKVGNANPNKSASNPKLLNDINIDDSQAFPSLASNRPKSAKNAKKAETNVPSDDENSDSDGEEAASVQVLMPNKPYIEDDAKFEKVKKNFAFIRSTIEQHYINENSRNNTRNQLSFKEAVLKKPVQKIVEERPREVEAKEAKAKKADASKSDAKSDAEQKDEKKAKKKKSDKKKSKKTASSTEEQTAEVKSEFDITKEDFPNLAQKPQNTEAHQSDAEGKATAKEQSQSANTASSNAAASGGVTDPGKKSRQPIVFEFANMISALEKGQHNEKRKTQKPPGALSTSRSKNGIVMPINPLDSHAPTQMRGKEREKPKVKKQSTLKKIILKEREEKKRLRLQSQQLVIADMAADPMDMLNMVPNELVMSNIDANLVDQGQNEAKPRNEQETSDGSTTGGEKAVAQDEEDVEDSDDSENESDDNENDSDDQDDDDDDDEDSDESEEESDEESSDKSKEEKEEKAASNSNETGNITMVDNEKKQLEYDTSNDLNDNDGNAVSNKMSPISQGSPISYGGYTPTPYGMLPNDRLLLSLDKLEEQVKQKIHSRKFREYCNQIINKEIDNVCMALLHEIVRFQDRLYHKNPLKAKTKRRYVMGIREVTKHLKLNKLKCVILAPNCEKIQSKGGLDDAINFIIQHAMEQNIPFVFALGRKGLGKAVNKLVPISVVGIFDYSGAEEYFKKLVELANNAKQAYQEIVEEYEKEECENLIVMQSDKAANILAPLIPANANSGLTYINNSVYSNYHLLNQQIASTQNPIIPSHMGHSRTPSNSSNISIEPYFHMNYHHASHSRSASGNFNFGVPAVPRPGHSRSASGGGGGTLNIDLGLHGPVAGKHWTHSRTPSNCSNISFISRLSEPISELGSVGTLHMGSCTSSNNNLASFIVSSSNVNPIAENSKLSAVQHYVESVRQEFRESAPTADAYELEKPSNSKLEASEPEVESSDVSKPKDSSQSGNVINVSSSLSNLHLGCISEMDGGNEAEDADSAEKNQENNLSSSSSSIHVRELGSSSLTEETKKPSDPLEASAADVEQANQ